MNTRLTAPRLSWLMGCSLLIVSGCSASRPSSGVATPARPAPAQIFDEADFDENARQAVSRDAFPVLDQPTLASADEADEQLQPDQPIIGVAFGGQAHAYPISVMGGHELINDVCGDVPIAVSW